MVIKRFWLKFNIGLVAVGVFDIFLGVLGFTKQHPVLFGTWFVTSVGVLCLILGIVGIRIYSKEEG